jgi:acyl carrier protein
VLESLPTMPNGKVNRRALPPPDCSRPTSEPPAEPRNPVEQKLAELWRNLLGIERVGIHDNFFKLGGQSLLALRVIARLRDLFNVDVPVRAIFENPTVAGLAAAVAAAPPKSASPIRKITRPYAGQVVTGAALADIAVK